MANILDYIDWRSDVTFAYDGFNDVDALILAELSYVPFEKVLTQETEISAAEAAKLFRPEEVDEKLKIYSFEQDTELLRAIGSSRRFKDIILSDYVSVVDADMDMQFAALCCKLPDGKKYISFRGTDATIAGWKEDFNFSYMHETPAQKLAAEYLCEHCGNSGLYVGGHSKGGNLAVYSAFRCFDEIGGQICRVYNFDGPGFRDDVSSSPEYRRAVPLITSVIPESSLVGQLLTEGQEHFIVKSSIKGVMQHLAYTWEVRRDSFVCAEELSKLGVFINRTMSGWLGSMDDESRRMFVKAMFELLESSDSETFTDLSKSKLKSAAAVLKAMSDLKPEQQQALKFAFKQLAKSSIDALMP